MLNDIYNSQKSNGKGHEAIGSANSAKMSKKSALQLFEFLCDNSKVEWSLYYVRVDGKSYYLGTSNNEIAAPRYNDVSTRIWGAHYHPDAINGTPGASYAPRRTRGVPGRTGPALRPFFPCRNAGFQTPPSFSP